MPVSSTKVAREFLELAANEERPITPLELLKLTYLAHGWSLGLDGEPLVSEAAEAWQYGPVFPELYHALKKFRASPVDEVGLSDSELFNDDELSPKNMKIIKSVFKSYKKFNGVQLSAITHKPNTPWDITRKKRNSAPIPDKLIKKHFEELAEQRNVRGR